MTAQRLYELLVFLESLESKVRLQPSLEAVRNSLNSLTDQPAQPQFQTQLQGNLSNFENAAEQLKDLITPAQRLQIEEIGGSEFFDPAIAENIRKKVQTSAMTPAVARDFVQELTNKRAEFLAVVRSTRENLHRLRIVGSPLKPGEADVAFLIPREMFDNELDQFAKELKFLSRLLRHYAEALTGEIEPVQLEELTSSTPSVAVLLSPLVLHYFSHVVHKFLDAWKKVEEIRLIRAKILEMHLKATTTVDEMDEAITTTVNEVVEEVTEFALKDYDRDENRKNELKTAIHDETKRLFAQIERGLTVEFRAKPKEGGADDAEQKALKEIDQRARVIQFPRITLRTVAAERRGSRPGRQ